MTGPHVIGIDLGGTHIKAALFEANPLTLVCRETRKTCDGEWENAQPRWAMAVLRLVGGFEQRVGPVERIGLCAPGLAAADGRSIAHMPERMQGLSGFDWSLHLGRHRSVHVLNDAHASLLGELGGGAARGLRNVYMLTLGTGVGGAAFVDGHLLQGHICRAGHLGHLSLDIEGPPGISRIPGSLEDAIGDHSVSTRSAGRFTSTKDLVAAYAAGDPEAARVWRRSLRALACGIASLNNILDPEAVILGGGVTAAGPLLFEPLGRELDRVEWRPYGRAVPLLAAQLADWAGAWGAAARALQHGDLSQLPAPGSDLRSAISDLRPPSRSHDVA